MGKAIRIGVIAALALTSAAAFAADVDGAAAGQSHAQIYLGELRGIYPSIARAGALRSTGTTSAESAQEGYAAILVNHLAGALPELKEPRSTDQAMAAQPAGDAREGYASIYLGRLAGTSSSPLAVEAGAASPEPEEATTKDAPGRSP
jgi:hypothetical protein